MNNYESAGTIIVIRNYKVPIILLGISKRGAELPYGTRDKEELLPKITANRETQEETSNLFSFSLDLYKDEYVILGNKKYVYVINVYIPEVDLIKLFHSNQFHLKNSNATCWLEFTTITFISINDAINSNIITSRNNHNFLMKDIFGNNISIFKREVYFIKVMIRKNLHNNFPIYSPHFSQINDYSFLNNTYNLHYS